MPESVVRGQMQVSSPARHLAAVAAQVAADAARLVRDSMGRAELAGTKSTPTDIVTHTDVASEQFIRRQLLERCPGSSIIGEELSDELGGNTIQWIVDPIDGTVNFLYDLPVVSVSIGVRVDSIVVAGAVADVIRGDTFAAAIDEGATLNGHQIRMGADAPMSQSLIGTGFSYETAARARQAAVAARVLPASRDIRCMGSAALNLCWVGCGRLDGYYEQGTKLYDYAAAALIAAEAGATVELPDSNEISLVVGSRPDIFSELRALIDPAG